MNTFISYSRHAAGITEPLAEDIKALGHSVWYDRELGGGQAWWAQILQRIRECDVFVFVLDPSSLNSTACTREWNYASALGKPVLPVLISDEVSTNLLPPALSQIQFVDYRTQDRDAAIRLARAFATLPPAGPLPDPLPEPPGTPMSYLGTLTEQVGSTSTLTYEEQAGLVSDLRRSLRDPETAHDARTLLETLRHRRELFATIAEEIDELLGAPAAVHDRHAAPAVEPPVEVEPQPEQVQQPPPAPAAAPTPVPTVAATPAEAAPQAPYEAAPVSYAQPPQQAPATGYQQPSAAVTPPAPRRSRVKPLVIVIAVVAALLVCGGIGAFLLFPPGPNANETAATEMVTNFFDLLFAGDYKTAATGNYMSVDLAEVWPEEELAAVGWDDPGGTLESIEAEEQDNGNVIVTCTATWDDGSTLDMELTCDHFGDDPTNWEEWFIIDWQQQE